MKIFLKYISRNMFEKKGRFFLLLFSIAISTALLVASAGVVDIVVDSINDQNASQGLSDVRIVSNTDNPYLAPEDVPTDSLKDMVPELMVTGIKNDGEKNRYVSLRGRLNYEGRMTEGNADFIREGASGEPSCIISQRVAEHDGLKTGDSITLFLSGEEISFRIAAISANEELFYADKPEAFNLIIPYGYLNEKLHAGGKYNCIYANVTSGTVDDFISAFNGANTELNAMSMKSEIFTDSSISIGLYAMMAIVVIVSAIIIYGVFKLILAERMTVIGTFMSQGATRKKIERIIRMEGLLYGLIGGAIGCALGETLLFFINRMTSPLAEYEIYTPFSINVTWILIGMAFSVVLSVASAYFPVRAVRKLEAKDVILNRVEAKPGRVMGKRIAGCVLIALSMTVFFLQGDAKSSMAPIGFAAAYAGIVLITPSIVKGITYLLSKAFRNNTTVYLAMNNIHSSKLLRNNIVLIVISLSSVLMIASFGKSMTKLVTDAYNNAEYDYSISGILESDPAHSTTDQIVDNLETINGVKEGSVNAVYFVPAKVDTDMAVSLTGIKPEAFGKTYDEYFEVSRKYSSEFAALEASEGRKVLLPTKVQKQIKKEIGDTIEITVNSIRVPFEIIGIYDGKVFNAGLSVMVKSEVLRKEFHINEASVIYLSTNGDRQAVESEMKPYLKSLGATWTTKAEDMKQNDDQNQQIVMIMSVFSYLAMIIASIGVFNNITICFFQRKRELAVMASVGMDKKHRMGLILTESLVSVAFSILISIPFTILLADLMTGFCSFIGLPMLVTFNWSELPKYALIIAGIILVASLSTMNRSRKLSVIHELKYE
ncbi:MAG: ABC transporter permease [Eubacterium sp.]|nr:ABC transporter permease [Eubacterium sp.]